MSELKPEQKEYIRNMTVFMEMMQEFVSGQEYSLMRDVALGYIREALKWLKHEDLPVYDFVLVQTAVGDVANTLKMYNFERTHKPVAVIQDMKVYEVQHDQLP